MEYQQPFFGYAGSVWDTIYGGVVVLNNVLTTATPAAAETAVSAMLQTCLNGMDALNASRYAAAWQAEKVNIAAIQTLPLTIDSTSLAYLNNRSTAYGNAASALNAIVPSVSGFQPAASIANGIPLIPDMGLLSFYQNFAFEAPPSGLSTNTLVSYASGAVAAFNVVAAAIQVLQGQALTQAYDTATRLSETAGVASGIVNDFTSGPISGNLPVSGIWNQLVTLPAMATDAAIMSTAPYLLTVQQQSVIRYTTLTIAAQLALFLLQLRSPLVDQVNTTVLLNNETLMDVAARTLGDFEQWQDIAELNGLVPPYVGFNAAPGIAAYGSTILLPTPGAAVSSLGTPPSYANNFLGIDLYIGPINGVMPPWGGDFQTIAGYNNLAWALGRRLQTTLGNLIYHSDYGSRIPPEVGAVQTTSTAGQIAAFGKSAILSDPRVAAVLSAVAQLQNNGQVSFTGNVQPAGFGSSPLNINEVISPVP